MSRCSVRLPRPVVAGGGIPVFAGGAIVACDEGKTIFSLHGRREWEYHKAAEGFEVKNKEGGNRLVVLSDIAPAEWLRPWKLVSLAIGMSWLIWGALTLDIPDWDIGVSILMGGFTYLLAPWSARILLRRRWRMLPIALFAWWWCVDGVYMAWHLVMKNQTFRDANFYASSCLYWLCGFIWLPKATLREIVLRPRMVEY